MVRWCSFEYVDEMLLLCVTSIKVIEHFYPVIVDIVYYSAQDRG